MKHESFKEQVQRVLESHYQDENFGVHQLAGKLHLSRSQLHRKLVAASGKSATGFIRDFRLKKAYELLSNGEPTVAEVAYACGFGSPSYFNTCFSKRFGFPPGEVRNRPALPHPEIDARPPAGGLPSSRGSGIRPGYRLLLGAALVLLAGGIIFLYPSGYGPGSPQGASASDLSIAVLPIVNTAGEEPLEAVCDGLTDDLIARMANLPGFDRVIARTSTFQFKDTRVPVTEVADSLEVTHLLTGELQQIGQRVTIRIRLLEGRSGRALWAHEFAFTWGSEALFEMESEVAGAVVRTLNLQASQALAKTGAAPPTANREAYDNYLQGIFQAYRLDEKSLANAEALLMEAITLDSAFAEAYSALAYVWSARGFGDVLEDQKKASAMAKYYYSKAEELDPNLPENEIYALQAAFYLDWDFKRLERFFHSGFLSHAYSRETSGLLDYAIKTGRYQDALVACDKSIGVNPLDAVLYSFRARALWYLGRREEAIRTLEEKDALYDKDWFYLRESAHTYYLMGEADRSFRILDLLLNHFDDRSPTIVWLDLMRAWRDGQPAVVQALLTELVRAYERIETGSPAWYIGLYHAARGDTELALDWLEKSFARYDVEMTWLREEPLLAAMQGHPRYQALLTQVGFPE